MSIPCHWPSPLTSWINGAFSKGSSSAIVRPIMFAARSSQIGAMAMANKSLVEDAIRHAKKAHQSWAKMTGIERGRILSKAASLLSTPSNNDAIARLECIDTSRPLSELLVVDVVSGRDCLEYFAAAAMTLSGEHIPVSSEGSFIYTKRESLGITGGIGAWNYPFQCAVWKSAPALAFGNAMIYKPSPETVLGAISLANIYKEAGLPDGLFQVVIGDAEVGELLSTHHDISKISFTGSAKTGRRIYSDCSSNLKRITMELGGKSPLIIFPDCDLDNAVSAALMANFYSNGQICSNGTRIFVESSIHNKFVAEFVRRARLLRRGDPLEIDTQISALVSRTHRDKVAEYIKQGIEEGAILSMGGLDEDHGLGDAFIPPTIFTGCRDDMTIVKEEIFGPVACVLKFESTEEVVERANATEFALAAGVFTKDINRAHQLVSQLQAGVCYVNNYNITPVEMPWGGNKQSGLGRENGSAAMENWTQVKSVYVEMGNIFCPYQ
uniref:Aldehyde dehydrogenase domain-containing protein n=1 Tax=Spongospora subterranea TaxID=70186 RepID=A0A0H5RAG6_9EUKA|eukprot:CRZ10657.1 hypothetical protein [Spongospora subterranea]